MSYFCSGTVEKTRAPGFPPHAFCFRKDQPGVLGDGFARNRGHQRVLRGTASVANIWGCEGSDLRNVVKGFRHVEFSSVGVEAFLGFKARGVHSLAYFPSVVSTLLPDLEHKALHRVQNAVEQKPFVRFVKTSLISIGAVPGRICVAPPYMLKTV